MGQRSHGQGKHKERRHISGYAFDIIWSCACLRTVYPLEMQWEKPDAEVLSPRGNGTVLI